MIARPALLTVAAALLAAPVLAQSSDGQDPGFSGQVSNSPIPVPKYESRASDGEDAAVASTGGASTGGTTAGDGSTDEVAAGGGGPGSGERNLPIVTRGSGGGSTDLDAGGRIKSVPDPDKAGGDDSDSRFVRAPAGSSYDDTKAATGAPIEGPDTGLRAGAQLRQLDKMTGKIVTFDIIVGQTVKVARLLVRLDACRSPTDNDTHGTMAYLKVWDTKSEDGPAAFAGWMFAESPALSALDHSRYDLWVINCTTASGEVSAGNE